jgi:asparagine synthase (glutamine-hydrolysing)
MCGFAGVISWSESHRTSRATLARMSAAIAHRGPDGEGGYFSSDPDDLSVPITPERPQVALAFRRLAVLDPTPCSDQPFVSTDGRYVLVFNGEIYNFRELRAELSTLHPDYVWRTHGDTEVLMQSFAAWDERCVDRLNGMFAFAVWDHRERSLFLARDRLGQKPLYVAAAQAAISFASEPAALSPTLVRFPDLQPRTLWRYLATGAIGDIRQRNRFYSFRPANWGRSHRRGARPHPHAYFYPGRGLSHDEYAQSTFGPTASNYRPVATRDTSVAGTKTAVERAVERQLVSDVPLGVFLSGGVDSSVIAACARKHGPVKTFSIGFDDPRYDETRYAAEVAKHLGTEHHAFRVTPNVIEDLPKLARVFGEPFADSSALPTHYLCRETRKHVTVALSGDGGDELFGGYDRYVAMQKATRVPRALGALIAPLARPFARGHPKSKLTRVARFASSLALTPADRYDRFMRLFDDETIDALLGASDQRLRRSVAQTFEREYQRTGNVVRAALATDRVTYLPDDLLVKTDRCSMLHSLEVRSPFMDHELVGLAAQLTEDQLLKGGKKRMLREAFAGELPASVFNRPKMGFAVPIGEWFRGPLRAFLRDHLFAADSFARAHFAMPAVERLIDEHESQRRDHSQRLYALLMLELWWDIQQESSTKDTNPHE